MKIFFFSKTIYNDYSKQVSIFGLYFWPAISHLQLGDINVFIFLGGEDIDRATDK